MAKSRYEIELSANVLEAARAAVGEKLPQHFPVVREPPPEMRELLARLVALDGVKQRAAERRVAPPSQLQPPLPGAMPPRG